MKLQRWLPSVDEHGVNMVSGADTYGPFTYVLSMHHDTIVRHLQDALRRYGRHDATCPVSFHAPVNVPGVQVICTCGFNKALQGDA